MKINEKHLCALAVSASPIDKEGYLEIKGEKNFQQKYFVLKGNLLFYFDKKGDKEPVGVIILEGCTIELSDSEEEERFLFKIVFHGVNDRSYFLAADGQEEMELWMKALACSGYDYMKLMVAELKAQLEEMDSEPEITFTNESPKPPPRQRHNPFNRVEIPNTATHHRMFSYSPQVRSPEGWPTSKTSITFREVHNAYGRPILRDYNYWKSEQKNLNSEACANLISF